MSDAVLKLLPMLEALTMDERHEVSEHLDQIVEESLSPGEAKAAWMEECERRLAAMNDGSDPGESADEVMAQMREKYG